MNYARPELLNGLAQRYVIGTLRGSARNRFERFLDTDPQARSVVYSWEDLLAPFAFKLQPLQPSELVWPRIQRKIRNRAKAPITRQLQRPWGLSAAMAAVAVVASIGWWNTSQKPPEVIVETVTQTVTQNVLDKADVAVINSADGQAIWVARLYNEAGRLDINVQNRPESQSDKDYQLWALKADGTPVSLGLLPKADNVSLTLDASKLDALSTTSTLAVSLEPLGGSPEIVPTGPVLYTAAILMDQS